MQDARAHPRELIDEIGVVQQGGDEGAAAPQAQREEERPLEHGRLLEPCAKLMEEARRDDFSQLETRRPRRG